MTPRHAVSGLLLVALLCAPAASSAAPTTGKWSAASDDISGRFVLPRARATRGKPLVVLLELRATAPRSVQSQNPFAFKLEVRDSKGKVVQPTSGRVDVLIAPRWRIVRPKSTLRFKVTTEGKPAPGAQIDAVTDIWNKLPPGTYTLRGVYSARGGRPGKHRPRRWTGRLKLPPVSFRVD
jgi:hypothetical protein